MRANEYGARPPWNVSTGGKHNSVDPFNKALKGNERGTDAQEYGRIGIAAFTRYLAAKDVRTQQSMQSPHLWKSGRRNLSKDAKSKARRNLLQQVVGLVAGSMVIVTAYQIRLDSAAQNLLPPELPAATDTADGRSGQDAPVVPTPPQDEQTLPEENQTPPEENQTPSEDSQTAPEGRSAFAPSGRGAFSGGFPSALGGILPAQSGLPSALGGDLPALNGNSPVQGGNSPVQGGNTPVQGGDSPVQGGDSPVQGGDSPVQGGDSPVQGGDSPVQGDKQLNIGGNSAYSAKVSGWSWNGDFTAATAEYTDRHGNKTTLPAVITFADVTYCTKEGTRTYTATLTDEYGRKFTDTRTKPLPATGHSFAEIKDSTPGEIHYRCSTCGEEFVITYHANPES